MDRFKSINKTTVGLFFAFALLYFAVDAIMGMVNVYFEPLFYSLIPEPHDWENEAFFDALVLWSNRVSWTGDIAKIIGLTIWMLLGHKFLTIKSYAYCLAVSIILAVISIAVIPLADGISAYILTTAGIFCTSSALGLLLWRIAKHYPLKRIGLLIGGGIALKYFLFDMLVFPLYWDFLSLPLLSGIICLFAIGAALMGIGTSLTKGISVEKVTEILTQSDAPPPGAEKLILSAPQLPIMPKGFLALLAVVIFMGLILASIVTDQLFSFMDAYIELEHFGTILLQAGLLVYILFGFAFDKGLRANCLLAGILIIGVNLAMVLFFEESQLFGAVWISVIYNVIKTIGSILITVIALAAPIYYAAKGNRYFPPQLGFVLYALTFLTVTFVFDYTRPIMDTITVFEQQLNPALGIALLLTFAALALFFVLHGIQEKHERKVALAAITVHGSDGNIPDSSSAPTPHAPPDTSIREKLIRTAIEPLTPRELEVAELTVLGIKRKIIAETLFIQSSTVDSHRISVYNKFGVRTRDELLAVIDKKQ